MAKRFAWFVVLFIAFFFGRLGYGYYTTPDQIVKRSARSRAAQFQEISQSKRNYASDKYLLSSARATLPGASIPAVPQAVADQKYEKTATMVIGTKDYDRDEKVLRTQIAEHGAVIQLEQNVGRSDYKTRVLQLLLGIQPDGFDKFSHALQGIGRLEVMEVTKVDKTNEFLDLKAKRAALDETRGALVDLKRMTGTIDELVNLQYKILDIDQQLQQLGVRLGEYDEVNEFCTVRFTLYEDYDELVYPPSLPRRVIIAFKWTAKYYLAMLAAFTLFLMATFFVLAISRILKSWADPAPRYERVVRVEEHQAPREKEKEAEQTDDETA